jgi:hypothetical protein
VNFRPAELLLDFPDVSYSPSLIQNRAHEHSYSTALNRISFFLRTLSLRLSLGQSYVAFISTAFENVSDIGL